MKGEVTYRFTPPSQPMHPEPGAPGWKGNWIALLDNGEWEFHRCVQCGRELKDPEHRRIGLGPTCQRIDRERAERLRQQARAEDRQKLRRELDLVRRGEDYRRTAEEVVRSREQIELDSAREPLDPPVSQAQARTSN